MQNSFVLHFQVNSPNYFSFEDIDFNHFEIKASRIKKKTRIDIEKPQTCL